MDEIVGQPDGAAPSPTVVPVVVVGGPQRRLRWTVALVVAALVAVAAAGAFIVAGGASGPSTVARWAPADSVIYAEARFDLPGDQRSQLGSFLAAFPGFADQSTLDAKLAELYDRIIRAATNGGHDYSTEIGPWFGGEVAVASSAAPSAGDASGTGGTSAVRRGVLLATVTDGAKAASWIASIARATGTPPTTVTYGGVDLTIVGSADHAVAAGVDGSMLIVGDVGTVHAIIDAHGAGGLAMTTPFIAALAALPGDHLAFGFVAVGRLAGGLGSVAARCGGAAASHIPAWSAVAVTASGGHLVADAAMPAPATASTAGTSGGAPALPPPTDRVSSLASRLPASTVAVLDVHDIGAGIERMVAGLAADPACAAGVATITGVLDRVGGLASFTSWLGDAAVVVTHDASGTGGGLVIGLPDTASADVAAGKLASLRNIVALTGGAATVTTTDHAGTTITTIDFGALDSLLPTTGLPTSLPAGVHGRLSYAIHGGLVIVGLGGDAFVPAILDTTSGSSLADQPRYQTAMSAAGSANVTSSYVDLRAAIDAVAAALPADRQASYTRDVKPYLDPLGGAAVSIQIGDVLHARFVLTLAR
ncbi:MAG: DUF3352 domain-containing protein [Chloroflexi bacterium]|nr:DUF3352 domain-containing protein [Chloroflexota bacterium]